MQALKPSDPEVNMENRIELSPGDRYNEELISNVHPRDWINPLPASRYNLVVIGAGTAGLVTAAGAAGLGAKVALVESHLMGGDCLNVGCVPSKGIIRSSRIVAEIARAKEHGIMIPDQVEIEFSAVMERMRRLRAQISPHDSAKRFRELGIDVFLGHGQFTGPETIEVDGKSLRFKKAVVATGARAAIPPVEGLKESGYLTNETIFSLTERPENLVVIGGGPIGCELSQAFRRLGSEVTIVETGSQFLGREDHDAAHVLQKVFEREGIRVLLNSAVKKVFHEGGKKMIRVESAGDIMKIPADEILVGTGRQPNVDNLNLDTVGIEYDVKSGIRVNDRLQTTNPRIFAAGDVCMQHKFTHTADAAARIVIQNALFLGRKKLSALTVPWCTYTDPEIAHVGIYERDAHEQGIELDTYIRNFSDVDRAMLDNETEGFVKIHTKKGTDQILGATIVASHAGDLISEITTAMIGKLGLGVLASVIHPYPTQSDAIKQIADAYNRTRLTPVLKKIFAKWFSITR